MNLKTYRAASMAEALSEVKKDLGKDAVILHTRAYKVGGVMGVGAKQVVEITASDQMVARGPTIKQGAGASSPKRPSKPGSIADFVPDAFPQAEGFVAEPPVIITRRPIEPKAAPEAAASPQAEDLADAKRPIRAAKVDLHNSSTESKPARAQGSNPLATKAALSPQTEQAVATLQDELASIKRLVGQVLQCSRQTVATIRSAPVLSMGGLSDPLMHAYTRLTEAGVSIDLCESIIGGVRDELRPSELNDRETVRGAVLARLARIMVVSGAPQKKPGSSGPLTIALIGPTGVGKTTTIAKLAAAFRLRQGRNVGLITTDTYRIAAVDQLRTYANIIGLPLKVAVTPEELADHRASMRGMDVVLVDTAGRSPRDATRLEELAGYVAAADADETHLVVSASLSESVVRQVTERFGALKPTRLVFSKLDEAVCLGLMADVCAAVGLPVSYVTTGQEVPDQIELASSDRLARLVLDEEWVR